VNLAPLAPEVLEPSLLKDVPARSQREDPEAWAAHAARVGHCHRPVKLVGQAHTIDRATGVILSTLDSDVLPDGVLYVKCGNRRASACQPCSREYGADMWHLLRAGAAGGDKGVPTSVVTHPMVFATLTAPSFGPVHSAKRPGSTTRRCRPRSRGERCPHGVNLSCMAVHQTGEPDIGQPMCIECYDYEAHVVWQWWAPELWRRFTIALPRVIAKQLHVTQKQARRLVRVSFAKVGEYQQRGIIHFTPSFASTGRPRMTGCCTGSPRSRGSSASASPRSTNWSDPGRCPRCESTDAVGSRERTSSRSSRPTRSRRDGSPEGRRDPTGQVMVVRHPGH